DAQGADREDPPALADALEHVLRERTVREDVVPVRFAVAPFPRLVVPHALTAPDAEPRVDDALVGLFDGRFGADVSDDRDVLGHCSVPFHGPTSGPWVKDGERRGRGAGEIRPMWMDRGISSPVDEATPVRDTPESGAG